MQEQHHNEIHHELLENHHGQVAVLNQTVGQESDNLFTVHILATGLCMFTLICGFFVWSPIMGILCVASVVPAFLLLLVIYFTRRKSNVEMGLLFNMFLSGMVSVIPVIVIEAILGLIGIFILMGIGVIRVSSISDLQNLANIQFSPIVRLIVAVYQAFIIASLVEELSKWLLVFNLHHRYENKFYRHPLSCMIYAASGPLGLATIENVGYVTMMSMNVLKQWNADHQQQQSNSQLNLLIVGLFVAVLRSLIAIPLHVTTGCIIGLNFQRFANHSSSTYQSIPFWLLLVKTIALAYVVHGSYDFFLMSIASNNIAMLVIGLTCAMLTVFASILYVVYLYRSVARKWTEDRNDYGTDSSLAVVVDRDDEEEQSM